MMNDEARGNEEMVRTVMTFIKVGMSVLAARVVFLLTLLMVFGLFCWAMYWPTLDRQILAGMFAGLVFLPVLIKTPSRFPSGD